MKNFARTSGKINKTVAIRRKKQYSSQMAFIHLARHLRFITLQLIITIARDSKMELSEIQGQFLIEKRVFDGLLEFFSNTLGWMEAHVIYVWHVEPSLSPESLKLLSAADVD